MESLTPIEWEVLNATADDAEDLEHVYLATRRVPGSPPLARVADAVSTLLDRGLLICVKDEDAQPSPPSGDPTLVWRGWFEMTPRGRREWQSSMPVGSSPGDDRPAEDTPPAGTARPATGRIYPGMFQGRLPDMSREEIDEARREMWGNFPRDLPG